MIQDARGWCTGMTQRDGMGRELEGEFRMRNTCTPMADSSQCMAKPIQCCKVKKKKKKRIKLTLCSYAIYFSVYLFFSSPQNSENTQNGFGFGFDLSGESITS